MKQLVFIHPEDTAALIQMEGIPDYAAMVKFSISKVDEMVFNYLSNN